MEHCGSRRVSSCSLFQIQDAHLLLPVHGRAPCSLAFRMKLGPSLPGSQESVLSLRITSTASLMLRLLDLDGHSYWCPWFSDTRRAHGELSQPPALWNKSLLICLCLRSSLGCFSLETPNTAVLPVNKACHKSPLKVPWGHFKCFNELLKGNVGVLVGAVSLPSRFSDTQRTRVSTRGSQAAARMGIEITFKGRNPGIQGLKKLKLVDIAPH